MQFLYSTAFLLLTIFGFSQESFSVYFDTAKHDLTAQEKKRFQDWMNENSKSKILSMEGFTDEVGSNGYNDTLSKKRVNFIYETIQGKLNIRDDFKSLNFGETKQINQSRDKNRRVDLYYLTESEIQLEEFVVNDNTVQKTINDLTIKEVEKFNIHPKQTLNETIQKVPIGTLFTLEDIQFHFDSAVLLFNAKQELDKWLVVLKSNPSLKIIIQGHICCIPRDDIWLSSKRAKAVLDYFVSQGIDSNRLNYIGYGSTRPKFKIPEKNGYEALMNRRVEIVIQEK